MKAPRVPEHNVSNSRIFVVAAGLLVVVVGAVLWWTPAPAPTTPAVSAPASPPKRAAKPAPRRVLPTRTVVDAGVHPHLDAAYAALRPDARLLRCPTPELTDGRYEAAGKGAHLVQVEAGVLTAAVDVDAGQVELRQAHVPVAQLAWSDHLCAVEVASRSQITGTLHHADGTPAVDHAVRGCLHGEFARTDSNGAWSLPAVDGTVCHPMAFVETDDGRFGKSNVVGVEVNEHTAPVALVLPPLDDLWTPEDLAQQAEMLAQMFGQRIGRQAEEVSRYSARTHSLDGPAATVARGLIAEETAFVAHVQGEIERLRDPAEQVDAVRDAWLSLN